MTSSKAAACALSVALVAAVAAGPFAGKAAAAPAKPPKKVVVTLTATVPTGSGTKAISNGGATNQQSITFSFTSSVANTRFTCSLDGARARSCTSPVTYSALAVRSHRVTVAGTAAGAHRGSTTFNWTIDQTPPPAVTFSGVPSGPVAVSPAITFSGESGDTFTCSIDDATPTACTPSATGTQDVTGDGTHTLTVVPTDQAGNVGNDASTSWTLDTIPPVVIINDPPASPTPSQNALVHFTVNDPTAVVTCSLDGAPPAACTTSTSDSLSGLSVSSHTLVVTATDEAGNQGSDSATWTINVSALNVPVLGSHPSGYSNVQRPQFTFSGAGLTSFECSLGPVDSPPSFGPCTTADSFTPATNLSDGTHAFYVHGSSDGTHYGAAVEYVWVIDTVKPVLSVHGLPTGATRESSLAPIINVTDSNPTPPHCNLAGPVHGTSCGVYNDLTDGNYTFTVNETDLAGNKATQVAASWRVDTVAPKATITAPGSLTGAVRFTFGEQVSGMTKTLVELTDAGTGKVVPTTRACHSLSAVVRCSGAYRYITLTPTTPLVPGRHYQAGLVGGIVHDAAGNAAAAAGRAFRGLQNLAPSTVAARYNWAAKKNLKAIGHRYRTEHFAGATSTYAFKGRTLTWWTITGPGQGRAIVTVSGHVVGKVNNYAKHTHMQVKRVFSHLGAGRHIVKILVLGKPGKKGAGTSVAIDAFTAAGHRTANPVLKSTWGKTGSAVHADLRGAAVSVTFSGTSFTWRTAVDGTMGIAKVFVDGKLASTVDNYSTVAKTVSRTIGHLTDATHTVRILVTGRHHSGSTGNQILVRRYIVG